MKNVNYYYLNLSIIIEVLHLGGKIMQHFKALRMRTWFASTLILGFALITFGCATNENHVSNVDFELTAEAVTEGILLTFSNIPSNTTHMWISVFSLGDTEKAEYTHSYADITNASIRGWVNSTQQLEKVKQTGNVIFPIVQAGQKYSISATVYNELDFEAMRNRDDVNSHPLSAYTECIAEDGVYFDRNLVKLVLNDTNSTVTLTSEPVFSSGVTFDSQKYTFDVVILVDEHRSVSVGDHHFPGGLSSDGLTWAFEPGMTQNIKEDDVAISWLENSVNYTAWASARANIVYDDIKWTVEIAKTPEFTYSQ